MQFFLYKKPNRQKYFYCHYTVCAEAEFFSYPWKSARLFNCDLGTTAQYRVSFLDQAEPICCAFIKQMPGIHRLSFQKKRTYTVGIVHLICPAWVVTWINVQRCSHISIILAKFCRKKMSVVKCVKHRSHKLFSNQAAFSWCQCSEFPQSTKPDVKSVEDLSASWKIPYHVNSCWND